MDVDRWINVMTYTWTTIEMAESAPAESKFYTAIY